MNTPRPHRTPIVHDSGVEARRRVLVGMGGLLLMLLLVMLAGYLSGQFRDGSDPKAQTSGTDNTSAVPTAPPTEPLGDGAVDPALVGTATAPGAALVSDGEGGVVVPDLQPDPELEAAPPGR